MRLILAQEPIERIGLSKPRKNAADLGFKAGKACGSADCETPLYGAAIDETRLQGEQGSNAIATGAMDQDGLILDIDQGVSQQLGVFESQIGWPGYWNIQIVHPEGFCQFTFIEVIAFRRRTQVDHFSYSAYAGLAEMLLPRSTSGTNSRAGKAHVRYIDPKIE